MAMQNSRNLSDPEANVAWKKSKKEARQKERESESRGGSYGFDKVGPTWVVLVGIIGMKVAEKRDEQRKTSDLPRM